MKFLNLLFILLLSLSVLSCEDEEKQRREENIRAEKANDSLLSIIKGKWVFNLPELNTKTNEKVNSWNEWQQFKAELEQSPTGAISAYHQKTKSLVKAAENLKNNIPVFFDKPQVKSRIDVIITKTKSLYTYMSLTAIPDKKVTGLINEVTTETISLQNQLEELVRISEIPKEMGEEEMLRALDTVRRANPR